MARWWKRPPVGAAGVGPTPLRYVATPRIAIPPIVCRVLDRHKMLSAYMALRTLWFVGAADDDMAAGKDLIQQNNQDLHERISPADVWRPPRGPPSADIPNPPTAAPRARVPLVVWTWDLLLRGFFAAVSRPLLATSFSLCDLRLFVIKVSFSRDCCDSSPSSGPPLN
jgi:hypothetical protein